MGGQSESCLNHLLLIQLFESRSLQAVHSTRTSKTPVKDQFYSWTCGPETECFKFLLGVCGVFVLRRRLEVDRNRTCFSSLLLAVEKERINWRKEAAHNAIDPHGRFRWNSSGCPIALRAWRTAPTRPYSASAVYSPRFAWGGRPHRRFFFVCDRG